MKRILITAVLFFLCVGYSYAQQIPDKKDGSKKLSCSIIPSVKFDTVIYLVDKVVVSYDEFFAVNPDSLHNITIVTDSTANSLYDLRGKSAAVFRTTKSAKAKPRLVSFATSAPDGPLLLVDGVVTDLKKLEEIKPESIQAINVLRGGESTAVYGSKGSHGVILVTTKSSIKPELFIRDAPSIPDVALLIVDGKIVDIAELPKIDPAQIVKIEVLKGDSATSLGGTRGKHGVILVTTKNKKKTKN